MYSPYAAPSATAFMGNYPPRVGWSLNPSTTQPRTHPMFRDPSRWVVPRYNRPRSMPVLPPRYRPPDPCTRRLLELRRWMAPAPQGPRYLGGGPPGGGPTRPGYPGSGSQNQGGLGLGNALMDNPPRWTAGLPFGIGGLMSAGAGLNNVNYASKANQNFQGLMGDLGFDNVGGEDPGTFGNYAKGLIGFGYGDADAAAAYAGGLKSAANYMGQNQSAIAALIAAASQAQAATQAQARAAARARSRNVSMRGGGPLGGRGSQRSFNIATTGLPSGLY